MKLLTMVVVLWHVGIRVLIREMLKSFTSCSEHPLSILPGMLAGTAVLCWLTLCRVFSRQPILKPGCSEKWSSLLPHHSVT